MEGVRFGHQVRVLVRGPEPAVRGKRVQLRPGFLVAEFPEGWKGRGPGLSSGSKAWGSGWVPKAELHGQDKTPSRSGCGLTLLLKGTERQPGASGLPRSGRESEDAAPPWSYEPAPEAEKPDRWAEETGGAGPREPPWL